MPKRSLKTLYSSFIQSHVLYGILHWKCGYKTTSESLRRNLRKAVRLIDFANYTAHSEPIFKRLKIFNFDNLYRLERAKMMLQINNEKLSLEPEFVKTKNRHRYNARQCSSEGFSLPSISTNFKKTFSPLVLLNFGTPFPVELK